MPSRINHAHFPSLVGGVKGPNGHAHFTQHSWARSKVEMSAREVVTIQCGHFSNFIGSHWWNIQVRMSVSVVTS